MKVKRRKRIIRISKFGLVCISIIVVLSILGMGYGSYQTAIQVGTVISTGDIDTVFTEDCKEINEDGNKDAGGLEDEPKVEVETDEDGKKIYVNITNAYPGYSTTIACPVKNQGTIPVKCKIEHDEDDGDKDDTVSFEIVGFDGEVIKCNDTLDDGKIEITVNGRENKNGEGDGSLGSDEDSHDYTLTLTFEQYNLLD